MNVKKTIAGAFSASVVAAVLVIAPTLPAAAQIVSVGCSNGGHMYGISNTTTVRSNEDVNCGTVYVRARYGTPGGNAWTVWASHASIVTQSKLAECQPR